MACRHLLPWSSWWDRCDKVDLAAGYQHMHSLSETKKRERERVWLYEACSLTTRFINCLIISCIWRIVWLSLPLYSSSRSVAVLLDVSCSCCRFGCWSSRGRLLSTFLTIISLSSSRLWRFGRRWTRGRRRHCCCCSTVCWCRRLRYRRRTGSGSSSFSLVTFLRHITCIAKVRFYTTIVQCVYLLVLFSGSVCISDTGLGTVVRRKWRRKTATTI